MEWAHPREPLAETESTLKKLALPSHSSVGFLPKQWLGLSVPCAWYQCLDLSQPVGISSKGRLLGKEPSRERLGGRAPRVRTGKGLWRHSTVTDLPPCTWQHSASTITAPTPVNSLLKNSLMCPQESQRLNVCSQRALGRLWLLNGIQRKNHNQEPIHIKHLNCAGQSVVNK